MHQSPLLLAVHHHYCGCHVLLTFVINCNTFANSDNYLGTFFVLWLRICWHLEERPQNLLIPWHAVKLIGIRFEVSRFGENLAENLTVFNVWVKCVAVGCVVCCVCGVWSWHVWLSRRQTGDGEWMELAALLVELPLRFLRSDHKASYKNRHRKGPESESGGSLNQVHPNDSCPHHFFPQGPPPLLFLLTCKLKQLYFNIFIA